MTWNSHPPVHVYVQQGKVKAVISKIKYLIELRVIPLTLTTLTRSSSLVGYYVWKGFPPDEYQFKTVIIVAARAASKVIFLPSSLYFKAPRAPEWVIPCEFNRPGGVCIYRCTSQFILLSCSWWLIFRRAHLKESRRWKTFIPCVLDFSSVLYQEPARTCNTMRNLRNISYCFHTSANCVWNDVSSAQTPIKIHELCDYKNRSGKKAAVNWTLLHLPLKQGCETAEQQNKMLASNYSEHPGYVKFVSFTHISIFLTMHVK